MSARHIRLASIRRLSASDYQVLLTGGAKQSIAFDYSATSGLHQGRNLSDMFVGNSARDLVALNMKPLHKQGEVYVVFVNPHGRLEIIKNFDSEVDQLCSRRGKSFGTAKVWATAVEGRTITLRSFAWDDPDKPNYRIKVAVSPTGVLHLVNHHILTEEMKDYL